MIQVQRLLIGIFLLANLGAKAQLGIGTAPAASAQLDVSSTNSGFLPPRMDSIQRNAIVSPVAGLTIYNINNKAFECYNGTAWYSTVHYIGERYGGGIVFEIYDNGQHGLIAATADISTSIQWYNGSSRVTAASGGGTYAGAINTTLIIATQLPDNTSGSFAAKLCAAYSVTVGGIRYNDYYLPSQEELYYLILRKSVVGGFQDNVYWSSTEYDQYNAWGQNASGINAGFYPKQSTYRVRAIRAF